MVEFYTSLVREKIIFKDPNAIVPDVIGDDEEYKEPDTVRSNRIALNLKRNDESEIVVVRAQNMHMTLRLAAKVFINFYKNGGPFLKRSEMPKWDAMWKQCISKYEDQYNAENVWAAIYISGKSVFKTHDDANMDIIEQCAIASKDDYDNTKEVVEYALGQLGQEVKLTHYNNIACVLTDTREGLRCGIQLRSERGDNIFSFLLSGGVARTDRINHAFSMAAAYLEAINLGHFIRFRRQQLAKDEIARSSPEAEHMHDARKRQLTLFREIDAIEELYKSNYRPEKPDFAKL